MKIMTNEALKKREDFKKRMMAQGKLPKLENDNKQVINNNASNPFELWTHYNKQGHGKI